MGTRGSQPSDPDLVARIKDKSRGGSARDSTEFTKIGALGVFSTCAWVGCGRRVTRVAPGPKTGYGGALLAGHDCRGGSAQWSSLAQRVRAEPRLVQGCKVCARPLCGTGEPVRGSCRAVLGCSKLAMARLRCGRRRSAGDRCSGTYCVPLALRSSAKGRTGRSGAHLGFRPAGDATERGRC